jgi:uncharacterized membrane protein
MVKLTPEPESKVEERPDDLSDHAHRQLIGYVGLVLPFALIVIALARDGVERWKALTSISAYYYTGGVAAFVGMLVSLSLFLFTYRGYKNEYHWADRAAASDRRDCGPWCRVLSDSRSCRRAGPVVVASNYGILHHVFAVVLFTMFAVFALFLFRITPSGKQASTDKQWRNHAYLVCGLAHRRAA